MLTLFALAFTIFLLAVWYWMDSEFDLPFLVFLPGFVVIIYVGILVVVNYAQQLNFT